VMIMRTMQ